MTDFFLGREETLAPANAAVALITVGHGRYLMQLRDQKPGIFYPGHWGVFGGAIDMGETPEQALSRELQEELGLATSLVRYFTAFTIDFSYAGLGPVERHYYEAQIGDPDLARLRLGEGREMRVFSATELLSMPRVVPYDSLAIWMHVTRDSIRLSR
jgi:8-oxo-dGTP pyrophosphatase MutT (NUDIX family)